jgi:hypothetical protein
MMTLPEAGAGAPFSTTPDSSLDDSVGSSGAVDTGTSAATAPEAAEGAGWGTPAARDFHRAIANSKSAYEIMA